MKSEPTTEFGFAHFHKNIYQNDKDSVFLEEKIKINDSYLNHQKKELILISENFLKILNLKNLKKNIFEISNPYSSKFVKCNYYSDNILMTWSELKRLVSKANQTFIKGM